MFLNCEYISACEIVLERKKEIFFRIHRKKMKMYTHSNHFSIVFSFCLFFSIVNGVYHCNRSEKRFFFMLILCVGVYNMRAWFCLFVYFIQLSVAVGILQEFFIQFSIFRIKKEFNQIKYHRFIQSSWFFTNISIAFDEIAERMNEMRWACISKQHAYTH